MLRWLIVSLLLFVEMVSTMPSISRDEYRLAARERLDEMDRPESSKGKDEPGGSSGSRRLFWSE